MTAEELDVQLQPILDSQVRITQIIGLALCAGVVAFACVCASIALMHRGPESGDLSAVQVFSFVTALVTVVMWTVSFVVPRIQLKGQLVGAVREGPMAIIGALRSSQIVAWALREGAALMGLVGVMIGATGGQIPAHPWIALDALPALLFVVHTGATLPNRERVRRAVLDAILLA